MKGLIINAEGRHGFPDKRFSTLGYGFDELISPIDHIIHPYYWILSEEVIFSYESIKSGREFVDYDSIYDKLIVSQNDFFKLTCRGFLTDYAEFLSPDWCDIYGFEEQLSLPSDYVEADYFGNRMKIYFRCTDAAFWEVFSPVDQILDILKREFPKSTDAVLNRNKYK